ncbi:hypothetical protein O3P69_009207 [Scylla paramamosain]|uniref:Uncharacterized protein n=1 Tax=Scylla paramamosain TaxID=85552 RepID=A0AAW0TCT6_SCYPA
MAGACTVTTPRVGKTGPWKERGLPSAHSSRCCVRGCPLDAPSNTTTTTTTTTSMKPTSTSTKTTSTASMKPTSTSTKTTTSREYSTTATTTTLLPLSVVMLVVFVLVFTVGYLAVFLVLAVRLRLHLATLTNEVMFLRGGLQSTSSREKTPLQAAASHSAARQGMESQAAQNFEEQTYDVLVL